MEDREFDLSGRTAVISGAGRGMGRSHALYLASRGASIVVNDLGAAVDGTGEDSVVASAVVAEIEKAGGQAVASGHDISTPEGGHAVIDAGLAAFGRVDILVHNAGFPLSAPFTNPLENAQRMFAVHQSGAWHLGQPAWNAMTEHGYGRMIFISSPAIYGMRNQTVYGTVKSGLIGLTRCLQKEADATDADIKINVVLVNATTRLNPAQDMFEGLAGPEEVSGVVAYLASPGCRLAGEALDVGATAVARVTLTRSRGWAKRKPGLTPEDVAEHLDEILDPSDSTIPASIDDYYKILYEGVMQRPAETMPKRPSPF